MNDAKIFESHKRNYRKLAHSAAIFVLIMRILQLSVLNCEFILL